MITQDDVKEWFDYHQEGYLIWKKKKGRGAQGAVGSMAGSTRKDGYVEVGFFGRHLLHRLIFLWHHGYLPDLVDHKDTDNTNNRIENLRPSDKVRNGHNSYKGYGSVKLPGVHKNSRGRYIATICIKYKTKYLGSFTSPEEAYDVYLQEKKKILGE